MRLRPLSLPAVSTSPTGTPIPVVTTTEEYITSVLIHADVANISTVYVGGAAVTSADGIPLMPGQQFTVSVDPTRHLEAILATELCITSGNAANSVRVFALERT